MPRPGAIRPLRTAPRRVRGRTRSSSSVRSAAAAGPHAVQATAVPSAEVTVPACTRRYERAGVSGLYRSDSSGVWLPQLRGGSTDEPLRGAGQVRLVVVAEPVHDIQGGQSRSEKHRGLPRPFDLTDRALGEPGGRDHAALHRPRPDPCGAAPHHLVHERADRKMGHRGAMREGDPERLRVADRFGTRRCRLRSAHGRVHEAVLLPEDQFPGRRGDRGHLLHPGGAAAPDPCHVGRVRPAMVTLDRHGPPPLRARRARPGRGRSCVGSPPRPGNPTRGRSPETPSSPR